MQQRLGGTSDLNHMHTGERRNGMHASKMRPSDPPLGMWGHRCKGKPPNIRACNEREREEEEVERQPAAAVREAAPKVDVGKAQWPKAGWQAEYFVRRWGRRRGEI